MMFFIIASICALLAMAAVWPPMFFVLIAWLVVLAALHDRGTLKP